MSLANIEDKKIALYNGDDLPISVTRLATVGKGIVGVLQNPNATKNRSIRIEDGKISFKNLASVLQQLIPGSWEVKEVDPTKLMAESDKALKSGIKDTWVWFNYIFQGGFNAEYGGSFESIDNDLVGLPRLSDEELKAVIKEIVQ